MIADIANLFQGLNCGALFELVRVCVTDRNHNMPFALVDRSAAPLANVIPHYLFWFIQQITGFSDNFITAFLKNDLQVDGAPADRQPYGVFSRRAVANFIILPLKSAVGVWEARAAIIPGVHQRFDSPPVGTPNN